MKQTLLILSIILFHLNSFSCDCAELDRDSAVSVGLRESELVFTGNLLYSDYENDLYCFEIFEVFKGIYCRDTIWGHGADDCSYFPHDKGIWIVYANMVNDTTIKMDGCLYSMSLKQLGVFSPPLEYIGDDALLNQLQDKLEMLESKSDNIALWFTDYEKLKKYKANSQQVEKTSAPELIVKEKNNYQFYLILFLLTTNLILLIVLIRKKK